MRLRVPVVAIICGAATMAPAAEAKQGGVLSLNGRVGSVYVGKATVNQVRASVGRPTSTAFRRQTGPAEVKAFTMRYDCGGSGHSMFWFAPDGRLANFYTSCRSWRTVAGTRVGDDYDIAIDAEGKDPGPACGDGFEIFKLGRASLYVYFPQEDARVATLAVAGRNSVLGC